MAHIRLPRSLLGPPLSCVFASAAPAEGAPRTGPYSSKYTASPKRTLIAIRRHSLEVIRVAQRDDQDTLRNAKV